MKCYYCKNKLPLSAESDTCKDCEIGYDSEDNFVNLEQGSDYEIQQDLQIFINRSGVTPARFVE